MIVQIVGWVTLPEFERLFSEEDFGYGPRVAIALDRLPHRVSITVDVDDTRAHKIAEMRNTKSVGTVDRRVDGKAGSLEINIKGIAGEIAVAEWLGVQVDATWNPNGGDRGYDLVSRRGATVDVKTMVARPRPYLYFNSLRDFRADVAALALIRAQRGPKA